MRVDPADLMRGAGTTQMSGTRGSQSLRRALLVAQAAIFAVLLTGASAFVVSLRRASAVDYGFDERSLMAASIPLPGRGSPASRARLMTRAYERVAALPSVESASLGYMEPWLNNTERRFTIPGTTVEAAVHDVRHRDARVSADVRRDDESRAMVRRRPTSAGAPFVVVVNEAFERTFWRPGAAVGQCVQIGADSMPCRTIVGVVREFHVTGGVDDAARPVYYVRSRRRRCSPDGRICSSAARRRATAAREVRRALQGLEPSLPAVDVHAVEREHRMARCRRSSSARRRSRRSGCSRRSSARLACIAFSHTW